MEKTYTIYSHEIAVHYRDGYAPDRLALSDLEHIVDCLAENYREGELVTVETVGDLDVEHRGWWKIKI